MPVSHSNFVLANASFSLLPILLGVIYLFMLVASKTLGLFMTSFFIMASHKTEMTVCELAAVLASNINVKSCFCDEAFVDFGHSLWRSSIDAKSS